MVMAGGSVRSTRGERSLRSRAELLKYRRSGPGFSFVVVPSQSMGADVPLLPQRATPDLASAKACAYSELGLSGPVFSQCSKCSSTRLAWSPNQAFASDQWETGGKLQNCSGPILRG